MRAAGEAKRMSSSKRVSLLLAITLCVSLVAVVATTLSTGQTTVAANPRIQVLHRDQLHVKPTAVEFASLRQLPREERQLEVKLPTYLPIKVKPRAEKEAAFKDLNNDHWANDLEIEIKNIGAKPIYYLVLIVDLPEIVMGAGNLVFVSRYGRRELSLFREPLERAQPEDIPIAPGETTSLKISKDQIEGWGDLVHAGVWPQPRKVVIKYEQLSFGDGTGYRSSTAGPWPPPEEKHGPGAWLYGPAFYTTVAKVVSRLCFHRSFPFQLAPAHHGATHGGGD
jgi:hypothetical protein